MTDAKSHIAALIAEAKETVTPRQREIIKLLQPKSTTKTTPKGKRKT